MSMDPVCKCSETFLSSNILAFSLRRSVLFLQISQSIHKRRRFTNLVPNIAVEREVDMKVLVMIIMKYSVWLSWLPPVSSEVDTSAVDDAVVICV